MATASVTYTFAPNTLIESSQANTNFNDLVSFLNTSAMHRDASGAFTAVPSGPATDPSSDNQLARKRYVDVGNATCVLRANSISIGSSGVLGVVSGWTAQINTPSSYFTTATDGITVTADGWYEFGFLLELVMSPASGNFGGEADIDGVRNAADSTGTSSAPFGIVPALSVACFANLTAGQKFTTKVGQDTGASRSLFGWMYMKRAL